jgi:predicted RNase H-like HicB family nuclease
MPEHETVVICTRTRYNAQSFDTTYGSIFVNWLHTAQIFFPLPTFWKKGPRDREPHSILPVPSLLRPRVQKPILLRQTRFLGQAYFRTFSSRLFSFSDIVSYARLAKYMRVIQSFPCSRFLSFLHHLLSFDISLLPAYTIRCILQKGFFKFRTPSNRIGGYLMLLEYIQAALDRAQYEIVSDDRSYYGEIPECNGVYANAKTLEECREELREVLEEWILFRVHKNLPLPKINGIDLVVREVA